LWRSPWLTVRLLLASLPTEARWRGLWAIGLLAVGFTVSLFILDWRSTAPSLRVRRRWES